MQDEELNVKLLEIQRNEMEAELKKVENIRKNKGKAAAIFNVFDEIRGKNINNKIKLP